MTNKNFGPIFTPFLAFFILVLGLSIQNTIIPIKLENTGFSISSIGKVYSCYYLGMLFAAIATERFIYKIGFLNSYILSSILFALSAILHLLNDNIIYWSILRLTTGFSIAAIFIIVESWCLAGCSNNYRGKVIAIYNIGYYGSYAFGQYLLSFISNESNIYFYIIFIIGIISIAPFIYGKSCFENNKVHHKMNWKLLFKASPAAVLVSILAGLDTSVIYGLVPVYLNDYIAYKYIGTIMSLTLLSAMIVQYPIGKLSDIVSRKLIVILLGLVQFVVSLLLYFNTCTNLYYLTFLLMLLGSVTYTFYPIGLNILCDSVHSTHIVSATQTYVLINIFGAIAGPIIAPVFVSTKLQAGIFMYMFFCAFLITPILFEYLISKYSKKPVISQVSL